MTSEEEEHLRLLSIFHFVVAGLVGLCSLFPLLHLFVGISLLSGDLGNWEDRPPPEAARAVGWIFTAVASVIIVGGLGLSACIAWAGRCLQQRRSRTFCLVVAGLSCLFTPFGTILGVFTLVVLSREGVKQAFTER